MKHCNVCDRDLPLESFGKWSKGSDGLYYKCKECRREYDKIYYANSSKRRELVRSIDKKNTLRNQQLMKELKSSGSCADCGLIDSIVMEFDHLRDKTDNVSNMLSNGRSWKAILKEIEKCEMVCANCHRHRTHNRKYL